MGNETSRPADAHPGQSTAPMGSIRRMDKVIRKKVRGEITYNMKILIRGARGTGKSSLLARLQGQPIPEQHFPTREIQTATINWSMRHSEESVKCEVWDVVDFGIPPEETSEDGMTDPDSQGRHHVALVDAQNVDVYQNAHGVIFLMDISNYATLEYVKTQLDAVPVHIPTLVIGTFRDLRHGNIPLKRAIFKEDVQTLLYGSPKDHKNPSFRRPHEQHYFEASLTNCYGLKSLHSYLGIPFLHLKVATAKQQLRLLEVELTNVKHDVDVMIANQKYSHFVNNIAGADIRTGRRLTKTSSSQAESVADDEEITKEDAKVVAPPPSPPTPTPIAPVKIPEPPSTPVPELNEDEVEDLPERGEPLEVAQVDVPLRIEHLKVKEAPASKKAKANASKPKELPAIVAAKSVDAPRRSWDKLETLEDFTVKTEMDAFYSDEESEDDDDEDVVVRTTGASQRVYRKQDFLYSDSEDDEDDKTVPPTVPAYISVPKKTQKNLAVASSDDSESEPEKRPEPVKKSSALSTNSSKSAPGKRVEKSVVVEKDSPKQTALKQGSDLRANDSEEKHVSAPSEKVDLKKTLNTITNEDSDSSVSSLRATTSEAKATSSTHSRNDSLSSDDGAKETVPPTTVSYQESNDEASDDEATETKKPFVSTPHGAKDLDDDDLSDFTPSGTVQFSDDDEDDNDIPVPTSRQDFSTTIKQVGSDNESDSSGQHSLTEANEVSDSQHVNTATTLKPAIISDDSDEDEEFIPATSKTPKQPLYTGNSSDDEEDIVQPATSSTVEAIPQQIKESKSDEDEVNIHQNQDVLQHSPKTTPSKEVISSDSETDDKPNQLNQEPPQTLTSPAEMSRNDESSDEELSELPPVVLSDDELDREEKSTSSAMPSLMVVNVATAQTTSFHSLSPGVKEQSTAKQTRGSGRQSSHRMEMLDSGSDSNPVVVKKKIAPPQGRSRRASSGNENDFVVSKQGNSSFWSDDDDDEDERPSATIAPSTVASSSIRSKPVSSTTPASIQPPAPTLSTSSTPALNDSVLAAIEEAKRAALAMLETDPVPAPVLVPTSSTPVDYEEKGKKKKSTTKAKKKSTKTKKSKASSRMTILNSDDDE